MRWAAIVSLCLVSLAGCGGAASAPAGVPGYQQGGGDDTSTTNVDELLSKLDQSERDLEAQLGPETRTSSTTGREGGAPAEPSAPSPPPMDAPAAEPAPQAESPPEPATKPAPSPCETACRALGSMQRSAERICELTGSADARCTGARGRVSKAEGRVQRAGCSCET